MSDVLTSSADVDVQVAFDDGATLQVLGGVHRVDVLRLADFITHAITRPTEHTAKREMEGWVKRKKERESK